MPIRFMTALFTHVNAGGNWCFSVQDGKYAKYEIQVKVPQTPVPSDEWGIWIYDVNNYPTHEIEIDTLTLTIKSSKVPRLDIIGRAA